MPFFRFKGEQVYFLDKGKGKPVILIHGFLGSHKVWQKVAPDLTKRFRVVSIDLPGHGFSNALGYVHSMEMYADCINTLIKHLQLRKVNIVGHSLGGYVAMAFAEYFPDRVKSLILVNSTAKGDSEKRKKEREKIIVQLQKKRKLVLAFLVNSFFVVPSRLKRYWIKNYLNQALVCSNQGIAATIRGMKERKEREIVLKFAPYPVLILAGIDDPLISVKQSKEESSLAKNGHFIILENSGHMSLYEETYRLSKILAKFIKNLKL